MISTETKEILLKLTEEDIKNWIRWHSDETSVMDSLNKFTFRFSSKYNSFPKRPVAPVEEHVSEELSDDEEGAFI